MLTAVEQQGESESNDLQLVDSVQPCPICPQLELEKMFLEEVLHEECVGLLQQFTTHECPLSELVSEAMLLCWGPSWRSSAEDSSSRKIHLYVKSKAWVFAHKFPRGRRTGYHPRVLLGIDKRPPGVEQTPAWMDKGDGDRFIIAELELLKEDTCVHFADGIPEPPRRAIGSEFDCNLAKYWLRMCENHQHSQEPRIDRQNNVFWQEPGFRLIDVVEECLVEKTGPCKYIALSYVWGRAAHLCLRTQKSNVVELSEPGALGRNRSDSDKKDTISRSVIDTMELVRKIGQRYLWVDALCIVQDDANEKRRLIHGMDCIYENALLTVIAADGLDANSGLPGICVRSRLPYEKVFSIATTKEDSLKLVLARPSLGEQIAKSYWNTRAWTYQEHCLSTRCLYFTPDEVFFECKEKSKEKQKSEAIQWREGYRCEQIELLAENCDNLIVRTGSPWWSGVVSDDPDPSPFRCLAYRESNDFSIYQTIVHEYSRRDLGNPEDVVNAFQGIFNRFYNSPPTDSWVRYAQGIPLHFLPRALLWYPLEGASRRPNKSITKKDHFSTWSWASWVGPIDFLFGGNSGLELRWDSRFDTLSTVPLYIAWQFPRRLDNMALEDVNLGGLEAQQYLFPTELKNIDRESASDKERDSIVGFDEGILGFGALYLAFTPFFTKHPGLKNIWRFPVPAASISIQGAFRFDEPGKLQKVTELVVILSSLDALAVLGVNTQKDGISTRVGIGALYFESITWPLSQRDHIPNLPWQFRLIRLR